MKKIGRAGEAAWVLGIVLIALGVVLITKSGFGVSSVVAPAYVIHLKLSQYFAWYSFGTSEYILQGVLLAVMCAAVRRFRLKYLLSFAVAVVYGFVLDLWFALLGSDIPAAFAARCGFFASGMLISSLAIALFFRTYLPLQVYELFVAEISSVRKLKTDRFKLVYDLSSLALAVALTLLFNCRLAGIGVGTIICAVLNAPLISLFGKLLDRFFDFSPAFPRLKRHFE
ncbi:MAG: hypothetical protein GX851_01830 [Clostridiales bacterium]|nr:hypothetical protein [Clostridiales bacterium]